MRKFAPFLLILTLLCGCAAALNSHLPAARWVEYRDKTPIREPKPNKKKAPSKIKDKNVRQVVHFAEQFGDLADYATVSGRYEALDVSNFDEAIDSAWFTNRVGRYPMTADEIAKGDGSCGKRNNNDDFSSSTVDEKVLAANIISSRILYAAGYNVPQMCAVGKKGETQLAVKNLPGIPLGKFGFSGKRKDDHNDIIPHELRRELRGLAVFFDLLGINMAVQDFTQDVFIEETQDGKGYVVHYLTDFSTAFGQVIVKEKSQDVLPASFIPYEMRDLATFTPPKLAFEYASKRDGFWAAKIIQKFSDDALKAIVKETGLDPAHQDELVKTLAKRRDRIVKKYYSQLVPLDNFDISFAEVPTVKFDDLSSDYGSQTPTPYKYRIRTRLGKATLLDWQGVEDELIPLPQDVTAKMKKGTVYQIEIRKIKPNGMWWSPFIDVYVKNDGVPTIMGILRRSQ